MLFPIFLILHSLLLTTEPKSKTDLVIYNNLLGVGQHIYSLSRCKKKEIKGDI